VTTNASGRARGGRVVLLARHGETDWNREGRWQGHTDIALNDMGRAQARTLAALVSGSGVVRVHASDLARARETAEIVAAALGLAEVVVDPALRERSFGVFEGLTRQECAERHPEHWASYRSDARLVPPGAESQSVLAERMTGAVARAVEARGVDDSGAVLVVSHGGSIRALLAHVTGVMPPPLDNVAVFRALAARGTLTEVRRIGEPGSVAGA
jgi:broad specificity phosphatase PhoE